MILDSAEQPHLKIESTVVLHVAFRREGIEAQIILDSSAPDPLSFLGYPLLALSVRRARSRRKPGVDS